MAEYKPSFVFQSKIITDTTTNNSSVQPNKQTEPNNILGSANPGDVASVIGPRDSTNFQYSSSNLPGSGLSGTSIYNDPNFNCELIMLANEFMCGNVPDSGCEPPRSRYVVQQGNSYSIECGCVDSSKDGFNSASDSDLDALSNTFAIDDCLNKARTAKLQELLTNNNFFSDVKLLSSFVGDYPELTPLVEEVSKVVLEVFNETDSSTASKATQAISVLDNLYASLTAYAPEVAENIQGIINDINSKLGEAVSFIDNDCVLNTFPSKEVLSLILNNSISNKPKLVCEKGEPDDNCECSGVCPSGTTECADKCYENCGENEILRVYSTITNDDGSVTQECECQCEDGYTRYNIPTNGGPRPSGLAQTPCVPECPEGFIFKEVSKTEDNNCTWEIDGRCYDCVCKQQTLDGIMLVSEEGCPSGAERLGVTENCECRCIPGQATVYNPELDSEEKFRCIDPCLSYQEYNWASGVCECARSDGSYCDNNPYILNSDEILLTKDKLWCPEKTTLNKENCQCECDGSQCPDDGTGRTLSINTTGSVCYPECRCICPSGTNWDPDIEECVCPSGAVPSVPGISGAGDCSCPDGKVLRCSPESANTYDLDCFCASGSFSSSYTSNEIEKIAQQFGYNLSNNVEFL
jgi:hypothetical protein